MDTNETQNERPMEPFTQVLGSATIVEALIKVSRAAFRLCDDTQQDDAGFHCDPADFNALSDALDLLDDLPDPPGEVANGARKAEYWLSPNHMDIRQNCRIADAGTKNRQEVAP